MRITEQCTAGCAINGGKAVNYRSMSWGDSFSGTWSWRGSASYITGAHNLKAGYLGNVYSWESVSLFNSQQLSYRVNNGVPNQLTYHANHNVKRTNYVRSAALYLQDQWRVGRLTAQGAVRYDRVIGWYPEQTVGPNRFFTNPATLSGGDNVTGYNDVTPRFGVAYDLFGNGKTSLKVSGGRYLEQAQASGAYTRNNPMERIAISNITRQWTDSNGNWEPDCDLSNLQAQNNVGRGGDVCGQISNLAFGTFVPTSAVVDSDLFGGWGVRQYDWQFSAAVQQEIFTRASVEVAYVRRNFAGFAVTDNLATAATDYTPFSIVTPSTAPGGAGRRIDGLFNVVPALQSAVQTRTVRSDKLAAELGVDDLYNHFNAIDVNFKFRLTNGLAFQGGTSTGQEVSDVCALRSAVPELGSGPISVGVTTPYCHQATGFATQIRGLATYVIPKIDVHVSGTMRSDPGFALQANHTVTNADCLAGVTCTLGRAFSGTSTNVSIPIVEPNSLRGDRVTNVDFHVSKILRLAGKRANAGIDVFNLFNASYVQGYSNNFIVGQAWPAPTSVMPARYVKLSLQFDY